MSKPHVDLSVQLWYSDDGSIHISSNDRRLSGPDGTYKGLNVQISRKRQPKTFQVADGLLQREGVERR
jgi:hypothetical protein